MIAEPTPIIQSVAFGKLWHLIRCGTRQLKQGNPVTRNASNKPSNPASRVALITGSTSGIGRGIATQLAADGYQIAFHSKSSTEVGNQLANTHPGASYTQADLADQAEAQQLVETVIARHGRLDLLVNNAGISASLPANDLAAATPELWRTLYEVNVIAPWTLITQAETALRASATPERPSSIINVSSHAGVRPKGASVPYAVSKAALNHMTKLLAKQLAPAIRVNAIAPGLVETPLTRDWEAARTLWREQAPMGRGAQPEDIAEVVQALVATNYLTGEVLLCDGGLNLT